jgi:hypothetical protein
MMTPKKNGRPTKRTPAVTERIISGLSQGTPLTVICREHGMPGVSTIYDWMDADERLSGDIARARDLGWDALANECLSIADVEPENKTALAHQRLRIDTRLKLLAKWDPKRYGELIKMSGSDGQSSVMNALAVTFVQAPQPE